MRNKYGLTGPYSFDGIVLIKIVRISGIPTKIIENVKFTSKVFRFRVINQFGDQCLKLRIIS